MLFMAKYKIKLSEVGNTDTELNIEGTIQAHSKEVLQELVLKMLLPFFELSEDDRLRLIETEKVGFKYETYGICVGSVDDWDCSGFFEIVGEEV